MDVSNTPRLLVSPIFNGWEPEIHEIIYKSGGRAIYADWDILGLLDEIPVSKNSDPVEDYARFGNLNQSSANPWAAVFASSPD